jgi:hypothetical protein
MMEYEQTVRLGAPSSLWGYLYSFRNAGDDAMLNLPFEPLDVNARVYEELGKAAFEGHDNTLPLSEFLEQIQDIASGAPEGVEVVIEPGTDSDFDDYWATFEIGYFRNPTDEERADRMETNRKIAERDAKRDAENAERERAEYERLKSKFEHDSRR